MNGTHWVVAVLVDPSDLEFRLACGAVLRLKLKPWWDQLVRIISARISKDTHGFVSE